MEFLVVCDKCNLILEAKLAARLDGLTNSPVLRVKPCECAKEITHTHIFPPLKQTANVKASDIPEILKNHKTMIFGFYKMNGEYREIEGSFQSYDERADMVYIWDDEAAHLKKFYLSRLEQVFVGDITLNVI